MIHTSEISTDFDILILIRWGFQASSTSGVSLHILGPGSTFLSALTMGSNTGRWPDPPIIFLTGGNSGVGYGIALRLLRQLSTPTPQDLAAFNDPSYLKCDADGKGLYSEFSTPRGVTIILACRNAIKAHAARDKLLRAIGKKPDVGKNGAQDWKEQRRRKVLQGRIGGVDEEDEEDAGAREEPIGADLSRSTSLGRKPISKEEWRQRWLDGLRIEFVPLDLSSVDSVIACSEEVKKRYPYLSHLILNAGGGPFVELNWFAAIKLLFTSFFDLVTYPNYLVEEPNLITDDGLGWTWQCNVFGHYLLARHLLPSLRASPFAEPRILWTGSLDGLPQYYDPKDFQATNSGASYQSCKFQVGLAAWGLNDVIQEESPQGERDGKGPVVRSFLIHPGVVAGNMVKEMIGTFLDVIMKVLFYIARLLGSQNHCISNIKAGVAWTYVGLAPYRTLQADMDSTTRFEVLQSGDNSTKLSMEDESAVKRADAIQDQWVPMRFGPRVTRLGQEYVGVDLVTVGTAGNGSSEDPRWWWDKNLSREALGTCERLRAAFLKKRGDPPS